MYDQHSVPLSVELTLIMGVCISDPQFYPILARITHQPCFVDTWRTGSLQCLQATLTQL
jgi:hypothetical protein